MLSQQNNAPIARGSGRSNTKTNRNPRGSLSELLSAPPEASWPLLALPHERSPLFVHGNHPPTPPISALLTKVNHSRYDLLVKYDARQARGGVVKIDGEINQGVGVVLMRWRFNPFFQSNVFSNIRAFSQPAHLFTKHIF